MNTNTLTEKMKKGLDGYVRITAITILPIFYFVILYNLASRARSSAVVQLNMLFAQKLSMWVIVAFSIYPVLWLCLSARKLFFSKGVPAFTRVIHGLLIIGIVSSHVVTWLAVQAGQYDFYTFESLIRYDLILIDIYAYWKSDRSGLEIGIKCLSVLIWLTAVHGIAEHLFPEKVALFVDITMMGRVKSLYTNPIISGSVWLIGFWLPFPSSRKLIRVFVKFCYVAAIFFTISKNTWIGLGISIFFYIIWNRGRTKKRIGKRQILSFSVIAGILGILFVFLFYVNRAYVELIFSRWNHFQTQGVFLQRLYHAQDTLYYLFHEAPLVRLFFGFGNSLSREFIKITPHFTGLTNLDNQYIISLYEFGIFGLGCLILWEVICCRATSTGDSWQNAAGMGIIAMLFPIGTYDPFTWEIVTFLLFLLSVLALTDLKISPSIDTIKKMIVRAVCAIIFGVFVICSWPCVISWSRTLSHSLVDLNQSHNMRTVFAMVCIVTGLICIGIVISTFAYSLFTIKMPGKKRIILMGVCLIVSVVWILWGNDRISAEEKKLHSLLKEESKILRVVMTKAEGRVYEDRYPWIYQKQEEEIQASFFSGEAIIPGDSTTILTAGTYCSNDLLTRGYLFTYLSEDHAIYTDDISVIRALEGEGNRFTSYYHDYDNYEDLSGRIVSVGYDVHKFYDPVGKLVQEEFYNESGEKVLNSNGYFAVRYVFDQLGNKIEEQYFGTDNQPKLSSWGYALKRCYSNDFGQIFREEFYGIENEPVVNNINAFAQAYEHDPQGNVIVYRYYDKENRPVKTTNGYAILRRSYNMLRQIVSEHYYGVEDEPILVNGRHMTIYERDEKGNIICEKYFDLDKKPVLITGGYALVRRVYNEKNQAVREEFYGTNNEPVVNVANAFAQEYELDQAGNVITYRYFDKENQPVITTSGYAVLKRLYNNGHQIICEKYFGVNNEPITVNGYHMTTYERNEMGDPVCQKYYDLAEQLMMISDGYAITLRVYNEKRKVVRQEFYGQENEKVLCSQGYFAGMYEYDEAGNQIECRYYDLNNELTITGWGYAILRRIYNGESQIIREEYYGKYEEPIARNGYHKIDYLRDSKGHPIEEYLYSITDEPAVGVDGYAHAVRRYNEEGDLVAELFYDAQGNRIS